MNTHGYIARDYQTSEWVMAWFGTTLAGGLFGSIIGFLSGPPAIFIGAFLGAFWAGIVGVIVMPIVALVLWICWLLDRCGIFGMAIAGGLTGLICGIWSFPIGVITGILGACGAAVLPAVTRRSVPNPNNSQSNPIRFTTRDIMLRTLVIAIILGLVLPFLQSI